MSKYISLNGTLLPADQPVLKAGNRNFQFGDGVFETLRMWKDKIVLEQYHFERLREGIGLLDFEIPHGTEETYKEAIAALCKSNGHSNARIRLTVFLEEGKPAFIAESWALNDPYIFDEQGLQVNIYPHVLKCIDRVSPAKTTNRLIYALAARNAQENEEMLILNTSEAICESTISNIFWVSGPTVYTPSLLFDGCVNGVMRRHLVDNMNIIEQSMSTDDLMYADEVFLTNAVSGIKAVKSFRNTQYKTDVTRKIFTDWVEPLCR